MDQRKIKCICDQKFSEEELAKHYLLCIPFKSQFKEFDSIFGKLLKSYSIPKERLLIVKFLLKQYANIIDKKLNKYYSNLSKNNNDGTEALPIGPSGMDNKLKISNNLPSQLFQNNKKENEEYKIKISHSEDFIIELENKMLKKDNIIKEEKEKNENLNQMLKEMGNISNNYYVNNRLLELEKELSLFKSYYCFSSKEKLISVQFISVDQNINYFKIIAKNTDNFSKLEDILYKKYPNYKDTENYFIVNGKRINRNRTLEENIIKNDDIITLSINDF